MTHHRRHPSHTTSSRCGPHCSQPSTQPATLDTHSIRLPGLFQATRRYPTSPLPFLTPLHNRLPLCTCDRLSHLRPCAHTRITGLSPPMRSLTPGANHFSWTCFAPSPSTARAHPDTAFGRARCFCAGAWCPEDVIIDAVDICGGSGLVPRRCKSHPTTVVAHRPLWRSTRRLASAFCTLRT